MLGAQVTLPEPDMMLEAMLEASDPASCYRVYFTKNAANTKDSTVCYFVPRGWIAHFN
jgi:hypothetical protein